MSFPAHGKSSTWPLPGEAAARARHWPLARVLALGLAVTLLQVVAVVAVAKFGGAATGDAYPSLCRWDGLIYRHIAAEGYRTTVPPTPYDLDRSNVAFFPGYPLAARWLWMATGRTMSMRASLVLAAQLAAWGFWTYWLLFLVRWRVAWQAALPATLAVVLHPAAFYLVVAYSESLFLFGMLGFLYWITGDLRRTWLWAMLHGIVMTTTRIGGLPVAFCPVLAQLIIESMPAPAAALQAARGGIGRLGDAWRSLGGLMLVGAAASIGGLAFFAYCQWRFGAWNIYMQAQQAGWNVSPDWGWWMRPINYTFVGSLWHPNVPWPDDVSRFCVVGTLVLLAAVGFIEPRLAARGDSTWRVRLVFYLSALALFALHASGASPIAMKSMLRYCLGVHVLLLLAFLEWSAQRPAAAWFSRWRVVWLAAGFAALAVLQAALAWRFLGDQWVA